MYYKVKKIDITSWKARPYGIFARVGDELVTKTNDFSRGNLMEICIMQLETSIPFCRKKTLIVMCNQRMTSEIR